jgi:hypothetical protein
MAKNSIAIPSTRPQTRVHYTQFGRAQRVLHHASLPDLRVGTDIGNGAANRKCARAVRKALPCAPFHHLEYIHKINRMQQILKRLDNMQHSLYWLSHIIRGYSLNRLFLRGFAFDSIESNSSRKYVAALGQAATRPDNA